MDKATVHAYYDTADQANLGWAWHVAGYSGVLDIDDSEADYCEVAQAALVEATRALSGVLVEVVVYAGDRPALRYRSETDWRWL